MSGNINNNNNGSVSGMGQERYVHLDFRVKGSNQWGPRLSPSNPFAGGFGPVTDLHSSFVILPHSPLFSQPNSPISG